MEHLFRQASRNGNNMRVSKRLGTDFSADYVVRTLDGNDEVAETRVELTIDRDIPIPKHGRGQRQKTSQIDQPMVSILLDMQKGESMLVPEILVHEVRRAITIIRQHYKRKGKPIPQFTTRTKPESKGEISRPFRVWRG
jgi:hypothetical protein